jgi:hypothetical protein
MHWMTKGFFLKLLKWLNALQNEQKSVKNVTLYFDLRRIQSVF